MTSEAIMSKNDIVNNKQIRQQFGQFLIHDLNVNFRTCSKTSRSRSSLVVTQRIKLLNTIQNDFRAMIDKSDRFMNSWKHCCNPFHGICLIAGVFEGLAIE